MNQFCFYLDWSGWKPEVWAAWVQAIGAIAAIIFSYLAGSRAERARRKQEQERARSYGYLVIPELELLWNNIHNAKSEFDRLPADDEIITRWLTTSPKLSALLPELHHLGDASIAIHQALNAAETFRDDIETNHSYIKHDGLLYDRDGNFVHELPKPPEIEESFGDAQRAAGRAIKLVRKIVKAN